MRARKEQVIDTLSGGLAQLAKRRKVRVINARGIFVDSQTLQLEGGDPSRPTTASGSRSTIASWPPARVPAMPKHVQIVSPRVMDSTGALALEDVPTALLVVGGGYIGLEMGTVYAELGSAGDGRRTARRPVAGRRSRSGEAAGEAAPRTVRRHSSRHESRRAERRRRQGRSEDGRAGSERHVPLRPRAGFGRPPAGHQRPRPGKHAR